MSEPAWLTEARKLVGLREISGAAHSPRIVEWLKRLRAWWREDETPWCGTFVAHCLSVAGHPPPSSWFRARAYEAYGSPLLEPCVGCVVVFSRTGGGHVAFAVGRDKRGRLMCLGGNQGNAVSIAPFDPSRVTAYRWPSSRVPHGAPLPLMGSSAKTSRDEA